MIRPFGNYAKIEVTDEYKGLARNNASEIQHQGVLRDFALYEEHLTESGGHRMDKVTMDAYASVLQDLIGKTVMYQEHADSGRKFTEDGVDYVMVPWYRIYGFDQGDSK